MLVPATVVGDWRLVMSDYLWAVVGRWDDPGCEDWDYEIYTTREDADSVRAEWAGLTGPDYVAVWRVPASLVPCDSVPGATGAADPGYEWSLFDVDLSVLVEESVLPAWAAGSFGVTPAGAVGEKTYTFRGES